MTLPVQPGEGIQAGVGGGEVQAEVRQPDRDALETFSRELFSRLLVEEYAKLRQAGNRDVHDVSKGTTLPIAREMRETYVLSNVKLPWYIDLLNITLGNHDLTEAKRRIQLLADAFRRDGTRVTENLDFEAAPSSRM